MPKSLSVVIFAVGFSAISGCSSKKYPPVDDDFGFPKPDAGSDGSVDGSVDGSIGSNSDGGPVQPGNDSGVQEGPYDAGIGDAQAIDPGTCTTMANTYATGVVNDAGCKEIVRDNSACAAARQSQGLSGFWLKFSCRVTLSVVGDKVNAESDDRPDYRSNYFSNNDPCHETYNGAIQNPNSIATTQLAVQFPRSPDSASRSMQGSAIVGLALNGVAIFGNFAAPGDDIYLEARTFDRCGAHPQMSGEYHYHAEPYAISFDNANFIGVMRDGYPIYGRRDPDGNYPTLDNAGGHTGETFDSPLTAVYHYHVNEQTSTSPQTTGQRQWFITTGTYHGTPAPCSTCN